jgi:serine/threonine-protein kinase
MGRRDLERTLDRILGDDTIAVLAHTMVSSPRATIEPERRHHTSDPALERFLGPIRAAGPRFAAGEVLGEGGMGVVRRAEQKALGREVAVKTVRPDRVAPAAVRKLVEEAWITGGLEHPNVVPVYDIHLDDDGVPQIVMKRIEGVPWEELMDDRAEIARRFGADDPLEWNLQTLMEVCNVVAFAHSRGIVHRDLKPENVMVGDYGEVYVVDWGLAISMEEDPRGMLPHVSEAHELCGTPCYMAPEMLAPEAGNLGPGTDVYLLGAILYEIATGAPPHLGETFQQVVASIVRSEPSFPKETPPELARICRRAMAPDPGQRFESVHQLRLALATFLRHQGSRRLATNAAARHLELEERLRGSRATLAPGEQRELERLFVECRFGYQTALEAWPENEVAARGMRDVTVRMVEAHLEHKQPHVATSVLGGLADPPEALVARVEAAVRAEAASREALERLGQQLDPQIGRRTRTVMTLVLGTFWTITPLLQPLALRFDPEGYMGLLVMPAFFFAIGCGLFVWARESMTKTAINRLITSAVGLVLASDLLFTLAAYALGVSVPVTHTLTFVLWFMAAAMISLSAERRMFPTAIAYALGLLATVRHPELRYQITAACNGFTTVFVVGLWAPQGLRALRERAAEAPGDGR